MPAVLITLPHCSGEVPREIWDRMREAGENQAALRRRILSEGDPFTDKLYDIPDVAIIRAPFSRFAVDLNRARGEGGPNGVIKTTDFQLRPLYAPGFTLGQEERERRLRLYYDPFHASVDKALASGRARFLLDGHSMTARGPLLGPDAGKPRPALCLGNFGDAQGEPLHGEPVSLDPALARAVREQAEKLVAAAFPAWDAKNRVKLNQPFDGGHILKRYTHPSHPHRLPGLLFEINRGTYLNEEKLELLPGAAAKWKGVVSGLLEFLLAALR